MLKVKEILAVASTYLYLLGEGRKRLPVLSLSVLFTSLLDVIGVGLVVPFLGVVTNPNLIHETPWGRPFTAAIQDLSHESLVLVLGSSFLFFFLLKSFVSARLNLSIAAFAFSQDTSMRVRLLSSILFTSYEYHLENDRARILNLLVQSINKFSSSLLALLRLLSESVVVVFLVSLLLIASPQVFIVLVITMTTVSFIFFYFTRGEAKKWGDLSIESNQGMLKSIQESIEGLKEIRTLGLEGAFISRLGIFGKIAENSALGSTKVSILPRYFLESGFVSFIVILVFLVVATEDTMSEFLPLLALVGLAGLRLLPSINLILTSVTVIRYSLPAVNQIRKSLDDTLAKNIPKESFAEINSSEFEELTLSGISFSYAGHDVDVIDDISLVVPRQQSIGVVGGSGAGKTTLIDLILGLLSPTEGAVLVNGMPIENNLAQWWRMVAYIPQMPFLSDDTVRHNIALGVDDDSIDEHRMVAAIKTSQLSAFIDQLPAGFNTIIGDRGIRLSGGQRQRIAIARALYFDRQVLIFDEATSALDSKTEKEIVAAIETLHGTKTMIIIAHRMSTLAYCDRIIEIKQGSISDLNLTADERAAT